MARPKKDKTEDQEGLSSLDKIIKSYDKVHYGSRSGEEIEPEEKITTSSVFFDEILEGGFLAGSWARFYSDPECGKTSMALVWARNWQKHFENGFVVVFNAEGRLRPSLIQRSGIDTSKEKFIIIDTNKADAIYSMVEEIIQAKDGKRYFFIIDSTDACERMVDVGKNIGEAEKIGGGATIASAAGKRLSLLFDRTKHFLFLTSQVRDKMSPGGMAGRGSTTDASGGNAPKFYSSLIGQIKKPWSETTIYENPSDTKSKPIGRLVEIKLIKTPNEKSGQIIQYPVKYGHVGGVWREYEAMMICQSWGLVDKAGAWFAFDEEFINELKEKNIEVPEKVQGEKNLREIFDSNKELSEFVINKYRTTIINK